QSFTWPGPLMILSVNVLLGVTGTEVGAVTSLTVIQAPPLAAVTVTATAAVAPLGAVATIVVCPGSSPSTITLSPLALLTVAIAGFALAQVQATFGSRNPVCAKPKTLSAMLIPCASCKLAEDTLTRTTGGGAWPPMTRSS